MWLWLIVSIVLFLLVGIWYIETHGKHRAALMYRYLGRPWRNENPYDVVRVQGETYTFHFLTDETDVIRGVLFFSNDRYDNLARGVETKTDKERNVTHLLDTKRIMGRDWRSVRVVYKGRKYVSYNLEDDNHQFQHYMEDRRWKNSIASSIGLRGLSNPLFV